MSRALVGEHRLLVIEGLHNKGTVCKHTLAKRISDAVRGQFSRLAVYKSTWHGCEVVFIRTIRRRICAAHINDVKLLEKESL